MILRRCTSATVIAALLCGAIPSAAFAQAAPPAQPAQTVTVPASLPAPVGLYTPQDKDERGLWMQADEEERKLKNSNFIIRDPALNAYVQDVFCRTVGPDCKVLRLYIVRTPYSNATTAPNGMIQIWSGLLLRLRDEAQLSAVLGHEYIHYRDRHMIQLWRELKAKAGAATFFAMFGLVGSLIALGQLGSVFSFSREMEGSADSGSVDLMVHAGYSPDAAWHVWEQVRAEADATAAARNTKSRKDKDRGMFASHPPTADRMKVLKEMAGKVPAGEHVALRQAEYRAAIGSLWTSFIDDQIKMNDFGASEMLIGYLANQGWTPALNYARGELYRSRGTPADLTAATGFYRAAIAAPDCPGEAWRGLGLSLLRSGNAEEGRDALRTYLTKRPDASDKAMIAMLAGDSK